MVSISTGVLILTYAYRTALMAFVIVIIAVDVIIIIPKKRTLSSHYNWEERSTPNAYCH